MLNDTQQRLDRLLSVKSIYMKSTMKNDVLKIQKVVKHNVKSCENAKYNYQLSQLKFGIKITLKI